MSVALPSVLPSAPAVQDSAYNTFLFRVTKLTQLTVSTTPGELDAATKLATVVSPEESVSLPRRLLSSPVCPHPFAEFPYLFAPCLVCASVEFFFAHLNSTPRLPSSFSLA